MKTKKLVVLFGSPRQQGFTKQWLDQLLSTLAPHPVEVVVVSMYQQSVHPCIDCRCCEQGVCPFNQKDDYQHLLAQLQDADALLIASPIYFCGFPTPLKAVIDRSQQFFMNRANNRATLLPNRRKGYLLLTAGAKDDRVVDAALLGGEMFFRCMNADVCATAVLEETDRLTTCPSIDPDFVKAILSDLVEMEQVL